MRRWSASLLPVVVLVLPGCSGEASSGAPADSTPLPPVLENPRPVTGPYDWLITGARVVDGTGDPSVTADVLLQGGQVAWVGQVDPDTLRVANRVDAAGRVLAPGFIDGHAHWDLPEPRDLSNFLAQGVTTIVLGQDGRSPQVGRLEAHMEQVESGGIPLNVAWMVGHNTIRMESGVAYSEPDSAGLAAMADLVARGMEAGAFGLTTGLEYDPGIRSGIEELVAVARPVAERDGVVMSHMRNEDADQVESSLAELLEQGRRSGARVHVSHLKVVLGSDPAQAVRMLATLAAARAEGIGASADVYPYTASFTGLSILFPEWARPPHDYRAVLAARREELASWLRGRVEARNGPGATLFASGPWAGRTLAEAAESEGRPFEEILLELGPSGARAAYFVMDDGIMTAFLKDPWVGVSSDGGPSMAHPRGYGTYARVLRRHVAEAGDLTLEDAVRKMSGLNAAIVGLDDPARVAPARGRIRQGFAADLVLFDPARVADRADFEEPHRLSEGMDLVWVNGEPVWRDGQAVTGATPGRVIRRGEVASVDPVSAPR
jgi:N-acyl-D-amino-acid deacylase